MSILAPTRRGFLLSVSLLPLVACATGPTARHTLSPRGDRLVALIQRTGRDNMTAPEAFALMGITNQGRDIPVRQLADDGPDGRYVVNLVNIRKYHEFVFQRRQGDVLTLHSADTAFKRLVSVRYARNGKPTMIADTAFAERDFQQQTAFWFDRIPGR
ncbi:MAG: hypothetical protein FD144_619 [Rhodospirillaceae bacterium]|nr:MAG: hypothetical protein FD144_619 [Rhodospirillaceae bacterium]